MAEAVNGGREEKGWRERSWSGVEAKHDWEWRAGGRPGDGGGVEDAREGMTSEVGARGSVGGGGNSGSMRLRRVKNVVRAVDVLDQWREVAKMKLGGQNSGTSLVVQQTGRRQRKLLNFLNQPEDENESQLSKRRVFEDLITNENVTSVRSAEFLSAWKDSCLVLAYSGDLPSPAQWKPWGGRERISVGDSADRTKVNFSSASNTAVYGELA
ncbi:Protein of unknown function [Gryllus bimaculatus]|nr:Protein of unknown function [Gryllus bimaculatus]